LLPKLLQFIHLLSLVCWLGAIIFFSFVAAPAIFRKLDRATAGEVVAVIFPGYYMMGYVCGGLAGITLFLGAEQVSVGKWVSLGIMIFCTVIARAVINPKAKELKEEMKESTAGKEKEELEAKFKKYHRVSVQLNVVVLLAGFYLLWLTASNLSL
jgi:putative copper export protein